MKIVISVFLLCCYSFAFAASGIMGYYQQGYTNNYIIVFTTTFPDGTVGVSHCRTPVIPGQPGAIFSGQTTLSLDRCDVNYNPIPTMAPTPSLTPSLPRSTF